MTRDELIRNVHVERQRWEEKMRSVDFSNPHQPSDPQEMSLRDLLHHVAWYEAEMVSLLKQRALAGSDWWALPTDERNANIREEGQSASLQEAYMQEQRIYTELFGLLQQLSDDEVEQAWFFRDMPPEWKPWEVLAENTFEHYLEHIGDIK